MNKLPSIYICLLLDAVGSLSYLFPMLGEWTDIAWAPLSAIIFFKLFGGRTGKIGGLISFVEEILPFTDLIPTFTIGYFIQHYTKAKNQ